MPVRAVVRRPMRWRFGARRFDARSVAFHVDGHDLVHISEIDDDGNAYVIVFASSHPNAEVIFAGRINVSARPDSSEGSTPFAG